MTARLSAALLCAVSGTALALPPAFSGLGFLTGSTHSEAYGLSADGSIAVGYCDTGGGTAQAFTWSAGTITGIGDLPGGIVASVAYCTSSSGGLICGQGNSANGTEAFKYNGSFTALGGTIAGGFFGSAVNACSSDGAKQAGSRELSGFRVVACRWNGASPINLGHLVTGGSYSFAWGMSGDGTVIVGGSDASAGYEAFRWTGAGGMVSLGDLHTGGTTNSEAFGISRDGSTIVGFGSTSTNHAHAFRWTSADGMVDLGELPGGTEFSSAIAVNANGSVIVGRSDGGSGAEAFVWDAARGMRPLRAVLVNLGVDMTGWTLQNATAISDDGLTIAGYGINPDGQTEAWVATLPCLADYNADGFVTGDDFDQFVIDFELGQAAADVNQDTFVSGDDFDVFVVAFEAGC